eukprot:29717-Chlamydomonas_euryale.AAC.3
MAAASGPKTGGEGEHCLSPQLGLSSASGCCRRRPERERRTTAATAMRSPAQLRDGCGDSGRARTGGPNQETLEQENEPAQAAAQHGSKKMCGEICSSNECVSGEHVHPHAAALACEGNIAAAAFEHGGI